MKGGSTMFRIAYDHVCVEITAVDIAAAAA
jgi:hypothetical protein